jgi:hypothetical protein
MPAHIRAAVPRIQEAVPRIQEAAHIREAAPNAYSFRLGAAVFALPRGLALMRAAFAAVHRCLVRADMAT